MPQAGRAPSKRGVGVAFGPDVTKVKSLELHNFGENIPRVSCSTVSQHHIKTFLWALIALLKLSYYPMIHAEFSRDKFSEFSGSQS